MKFKKNILLVLVYLLLFIISIFLIIETINLISITNQSTNSICQINYDELSIHLYAKNDNNASENMSSTNYKAIEIGVTVGVLGTIIIVLLIIYFIKKRRGTL